MGDPDDVDNHAAMIGPSYRGTGPSYPMRPVHKDSLWQLQLLDSRQNRPTGHPRRLADTLHPTMPQYLGLHRRIQPPLALVQNPFKLLMPGCDQCVSSHPPSLPGRKQKFK